MLLPSVRPNQQRILTVSEMMLTFPLKQATDRIPSNDSIGASEDYECVSTIPQIVREHNYYHRVIPKCLLSSVVILFVLVFALFALIANPITEIHHEV